MTPFQIIALAFLSILLTATLMALVKRTVTRREGFVLAIVWATAGVAIAWPELTRKIANAVGIGRGADLVLYCTAVVMMIGFVMVYARLRRLRREITLLVRHIAIKDAINAAPPYNEPASSPSSSHETT